MFSIFARSFMIATRTTSDGIVLPPVPKAKPQWLPEGHRWLKRN